MGVVTLISGRVTRVFQKVFASENLSLSADRVVQQIEGWDSMGHVMLIAELEQEFAIQFELEELVAMRTVGQFLDTIQRKIPSKHG